MAPDTSPTIVVVAVGDVIPTVITSLYTPADTFKVSPLAKPDVAPKAKDNVSHALATDVPEAAFDPVGFT
jgi:hypothetical protein